MIQNIPDGLVVAFIVIVAFIIIWKFCSDKKPYIDDVVHARRVAKYNRDFPNG